MNQEVKKNEDMKQNQDMEQKADAIEKVDAGQSHDEKQNDVLEENKMGTMPVNRLIINMSLPMMISMLVQAMYNIVDSIFVAKLSENALTAVSLAFPVQMLMIAVGGGTGVGINALLSRALGEKDQGRVNKAAENGIFLGVLSYFAFLAVGIFVTGPFFRGQTAEADIVQYGIQYLTICCVCSFGMFTQFIFERLLQATGKTFYTMITQGTGAIINIILDPILIFGLLGLPKFGVAGAAMATVIGQCVAGMLALIINIKKNHEIQFSFRNFRPDKKIIGNIYAVGIPSIIMQSIGSVMTYGMNRILIAFTPTAAAVFGVYFKLQSFIFMPVFGLNNGMIPIVAYNYGAKKKERLMKAIKLGIMYAVGIMVIGFIVFQLIPGRMLMLFSASDNMLEIGVPALRIISVSFVFAGYCIVAGTVFQALGHAMNSLIVSVARQLVVILPVAYLLASFLGLHFVWWAIPIAEIVSVLMSTAFLVKLYRNVIKPLDNSGERPI